MRLFPPHESIVCDIEATMAGVIEFGSKIWCCSGGVFRGMAEEAIADLCDSEAEMPLRKNLGQAAASIMFLDWNCLSRPAQERFQIKLANVIKRQSEAGPPENVNREAFEGFLEKLRELHSLMRTTLQEDGVVQSDES